MYRSIGNLNRNIRSNERTSDRSGNLFNLQKWNQQINIIFFFIILVNYLNYIIKSKRMQEVKDDFESPKFIFKSLPSIVEGRSESHSVCNICGSILMYNILAWHFKACSIKHRQKKNAKKLLPGQQPSHPTLGWEEKIEDFCRSHEDVSKVNKKPIEQVDL